MSGLFESGELKERLQQPTTNSSLVHVYFPSYGVFNALKHVSFNGIHQLSILVFLPVSFSLCLSNVHNRNTVHRFSVFFLFLCFFFQISKKLLFISHCLSVCLSVSLSVSLFLLLLLLLLRLLVIIILLILILVLFSFVISFSGGFFFFFSLSQSCGMQSSTSRIRDLQINQSVSN